MLLTAAFKLVLPPAVAKLNEAIPTPPVLAFHNTKRRQRLPRRCNIFIMEKSRHQNPRSTNITKEYISLFQGGK